MRAGVLTGMRATVLSPFHYHSLAVPGGTATQAGFLTDRQVAFALGAALGCLAPMLALPERNYKRHLGQLPFAASAFESPNPDLLPPIVKRLNLDEEAPYDNRVQTATGTGNLKTFFSVQEVRPGVVYDGFVFGADPFALAAEAEGHEVAAIIVRTGRHLGGMLKFERRQVESARINLHTLALFRDPGAIKMDLYVLHDLQLSARLEAKDIPGHLAVIALEKAA